MILAATILDPTTPEVDLMAAAVETVGEAAATE